MPGFSSHLTTGDRSDPPFRDGDRRAIGTDQLCSLRFGLLKLLVNVRAQPTLYGQSEQLCWLNLLRDIIGMRGVTEADCNVIERRGIERLGVEIVRDIKEGLCH